MDFTYKITVFTPTYNRAYIIETLYRSLQRQTYRDFEWLVVDDGSADNTKELFEAWQQEDNFFPIRYVKQENGGKCRAINKGLELADGELFFTVDSDDYLTDDALEKVAAWDAELPNKEQYCGFVGNRGTTPTETPNHLFKGGYHDGTALDRYTQLYSMDIAKNAEGIFSTYPHLGCANKLRDQDNRTLCAYHSISKTILLSISFTAGDQESSRS